MSQPRTPAVPRRRGEGALTMARREGGDGVGGTRPHHCVKRHLKRHPCRMHRQPTEAGEAQGPHLHGEQVADGEGRGAAGALRGVGDDGGTVRASARGGRVHLDPHCHRELLRRELGEAVGLNERTGLRVEQGERGGPGKQRRRRWRELQHAAGSQRARLDERPLGRVEGAHLPDGLSAWRSRQPRLAGGVTDHAVATAEAVALGGAVGLEHPQHRAGRLDVAGADTHGVDAEDTALGRVDGGRLGAAALGVVGVQVRLVGPALAHAVAGVHVASPGSAEMQVHVGHVAQPRVPREHKGGLARVELGHHENPFRVDHARKQHGRPPEGHEARRCGHDLAVSNRYIDLEVTTALGLEGGHGALALHDLCRPGKGAENWVLNNTGRNRSCVIWLFT
mmetsp:Transcript_89063/g.237618  ORF Transcript_89063/g.237618 Transcript_89063/m.237618 type:complete len:394 (-) Transcript_89063:850-2031(-)